MLSYDALVIMRQEKYEHLLQEAERERQARCLPAAQPAWGRQVRTIAQRIGSHLRFQRQQPCCPPAACC